MDRWARACPCLLHCPGPEFPRPQLVSEVAGCRGTNALTAPAAQTPSHSPQLEEGTESPCGEGTGPPWVIVQPALQMWGAVRASRVRAFLLCGNAEGTWVSSETCHRGPTLNTVQFRRKQRGDSGPAAPGAGSADSSEAGGGIPERVMLGRQLHGLRKARLPPRDPPAPPPPCPGAPGATQKQGGGGGGGEAAVSWGLRSSRGPAPSADDGRPRPSCREGALWSWPGPLEAETHPRGEICLLRDNRSPLGSLSLLTCLRTVLWTVWNPETPCRSLQGVRLPGHVSL